MSTDPADAIAQPPAFNLETEYDRMVADLRQVFTARATPIAEILLCSRAGRVRLSFRTLDQYLFAVNGAAVPSRSENYCLMPSLRELSQSQIIDSVGLTWPSEARSDQRAFRILCFITSEAARFHVFSRNISALIRRGYPPINFIEAVHLMRNCDNARDHAQIGPDEFRPLMDIHVHRARRATIPPVRQHDPDPGAHVGGRDYVTRAQTLNDVLHRPVPPP